MPPFNSAILFSGGGLRFGYYLGMYQALCDDGKKPDIVLASCGGAFVAGLLEVAPDPKQAFELMLSHDFYSMLQRITPNPPRHRTDYVLPAVARLLTSQLLDKMPPFWHTFASLNQPISPKILETLTRQSLAIIDNESDSNPFWQFNPNHKIPSAINAIILASQLLETNHQLQWQPLLRCTTPALAEQLRALDLPNVMATYNSTKIHANHALIDDMPLSIAVRASISDMFYLPPLQWQNKTLMGGVLNLTPIELACGLANTVYAETKAGYDKLLAEPAIRSVFGFSPNERLGHVHNFSPTTGQIHWINTADNAQHLRPALAKKLNLRQGYMDVVRPNFATYQAIMTEQFKFGYQRTVQCLEKA